jgi:uncharacterized cupredoxin-like copper-binding protein
MSRPAPSPARAGSIKEKIMIAIAKSAMSGAVLALVLVSLSDQGARADAGVDVTLTDKGMEAMAMNLNPAEVKAGNITFNVSSTSEDLVHEFVVVRSDLAPNQVPYIAADDNEVDEAKMNILGEAEDIEPGKTKTLTLNLEPGEYILMCNEVGHYKAGMETTLKVVP